MNYFSSLVYSYFLYLFLIFCIIYFSGGKERSWERKRFLGTTVVVIFTIILLPLHFWGIYNLAGVESGGLFVEGGAPFGLMPEDTYTSDTLSNRLAVELSILLLYVDDGDVTFYICDENSPEVHYREDVYSIGNHEIYIGLPYLYTELFTPAKWTLNLHNPSQNTSAYGFFELFLFDDSGIIIDPPPLFEDPISYFQLPTIALFYLWTVWGMFTLASYESKKNIKENCGGVDGGSNVGIFKTQTYLG